MFRDLLSFISVDVVGFFQSLVFDFGDFSFNLWDFIIGAAALSIIAWLLKRILE